MGNGNSGSFRGRLAAAPLTRAPRLARPPLGTSFRGRLAAAPLTREPNPAIHGAGLFPRPFGRGPIDATSTSAKAAPTSAFRGRLAAAPLTRDTARSFSLTPRPFRGRLAAAPLTRRMLGDDAGGACGFPRPFGRGPIDARADGPVSRRADTFRGRLAAAPLTPVKVLGAVAVRELSAAVWPRPH